MAAQTLTSPQLDHLQTAHPSVAEPPGVGLDSPFLHLLATAGRELLSKLMTELHFRQGEVVFKEGELGDAMYIIWSGRVAVVKGDLESATLLGHRGPGEIIGEMALLENQPRSASIVALEDSRLLSIRRDDFETLLTSNPAVGMSILGTLSARLRAADAARDATVHTKDRLIKQVSELQTEKQQLLELQQLRQDTIDLIVHDLRHPISSLLGVVKILEMVLPEEVLQANREILNIANLNCEHMQLMVDSLLDIARMEAGEAQLRLDAVNLQHLIQEVIDKTTIFKEMQNIAIHFSIPAGLPTIVADGEKINRVMANLLNNAIKYTPRGGQIMVAAKSQNGHVQVSVTDTGPGVPPNERERIFDRFAQISGEFLRTGFGLGLAFCRLTVEAHGGQIWVESGNNDIGSRFVFTLPRSAHPPDEHTGHSK